MGESMLCRRSNPRRFKRKGGGVPSSVAERAPPFHLWFSSAAESRACASVFYCAAEMCASNDEFLLNACPEWTISDSCTFGEQRELAHPHVCTTCGD
jgi:hypothetical protein